MMATTQEGWPLPALAKRKQTRSLPMSLSKSRLIVSGLACAGLGAIALGYAAPQLGKTWSAGSNAQAVAQESAPVRIAERTETAPPPAAPAASRDSIVRVDAPHTAVRVDKDSGKVAVRAPYTNVKVDPDRGQVRVRAPYVNLDIRW
jgi:hypothetical protein